jgi:hypothetical protein
MEDTFALGGEWGVCAPERPILPDAKRGKYEMLTSLGGGAGLVLTNVVFLVANSTIGENSPDSSAEAGESPSYSAQSWSSSPHTFGSISTKYRCSPRKGPAGI